MFANGDIKKYRVELLGNQMDAEASNLPYDG